jgi:DNA modification methylase
MDAIAASAETFLDGRVTLHAGDSRDVVAVMSDCSVDSLVCDPPYALTSIVKRFANSPRSEATENTENPYGRTGRGFMGERWDTGDTAHTVEFWRECYRVLKPGGFVLAFGGTRTYHRLATAIENAGFEIRDMVQWLYGSGFPKSHDVGNGFDKSLDWFDDDEIAKGMCSHFAAYHDGWGTALKPACEPICMARKPLSEKTVAANVLKWGTGAINIDGCRVEGGKDVPASPRRAAQHSTYGDLSKDPGTGSGWDPAVGRFPANIIHDGSDEVMAAFPEAPGQQRGVGPQHGAKDSVNVYGNYGPRDQFDPRGDTGSSARFFYTAKADNDDRLGSKHPTVKPVDLKQWLCRLVTPKGGTILDPFAGTGTTGEAAFREGFNAILIEREEKYLADIRRRMRLVKAGPQERRQESAKARGEPPPFPAGSLFGEW